MNIRIFDAEGERPYRRHVHSDGAINIATDTPFWFGPVTIRVEPSHDQAFQLMELVLVTDAVRRNMRGSDDLHLVMPYCPYAREDRVCNPGESFGAKVFCDIINAQHYKSVEIWDAHSDVVPAMLNRVNNVHCSEFVRQIVTPGTILVAPDAGAAKKVWQCAKTTGLPMVALSKKRDTATGHITETKADLSDPAFDPLNASNHFLIVDDICDGGRTFIEVAKILRGNTLGKRISLYVTHGIMSNGWKVFDGLIDEVFIANPFPGLAGYTTIKKWPQHASVSAPRD